MANERCFEQVSIVEMMSENTAHGDPDDGCPQEALRDYLKEWDQHQGEDGWYWKGEHRFSIWSDPERPGAYYANAYTKDGVFTTYYELSVASRGAA